MGKKSKKKTSRSSSTKKKTNNPSSIARRSSSIVRSSSVKKNRAEDVIEDEILDNEETGATELKASTSTNGIAEKSTGVKNEKSNNEVIVGDASKAAKRAEIERRVTEDLVKRKDDERLAAESPNKKEKEKSIVKKSEEAILAFDALKEVEGERLAAKTAQKQKEDSAAVSLEEWKKINQGRSKEDQMEIQRMAELKLKEFQNSAMANVRKSSLIDEEDEIKLDSSLPEDKEDNGGSSGTNSKVEKLYTSLPEDEKVNGDGSGINSKAEITDVSKFHKADETAPPQDKVIEVPELNDEAVKNCDIKTESPVIKLMDACNDDLSIHKIANPSYADIVMASSRDISSLEGVAPVPANNLVCGCVMAYENGSDDLESSEKVKTDAISGKISNEDKKQIEKMDKNSMMKELSSKDMSSPESPEEEKQDCGCVVS